MQSKIFSVNKTLNIGGRLVDLFEPKIMGILNVTPDSFSDGFRFTDETAILNQVEKMIQEGADFIDIGGYSTRPGAEGVSEEEELQRVLPAIKAVVKKFPETTVSIDTFRSAVAIQAVASGAAIVNDISCGESDHHMFGAVAALKVPYVAMHMRGTPQTMTQLTDYNHLLKEIIDYFHQKIALLYRAGVTDIIIDPGFGFAKTRAQNFELLNKLEYFKMLGKPILAGLSRKSMIWKTLKTDPEHALNGTTALNTIALLKGASIIRVHDVREARETIQLINQLVP